MIDLDDDEYIELTPGPAQGAAWWPCFDLGEGCPQSRKVDWRGSQTAKDYPRLWPDEPVFLRWERDTAYALLAQGLVASLRRSAEVAQLRERVAEFKNALDDLGVAANTFAHGDADIGGRDWRMWFETLREEAWSVTRNG